MDRKIADHRSMAKPLPLQKKETMDKVLDEVSDKFSAIEKVIEGGLIAKSEIIYRSFALSALYHSIPEGNPLESDFKQLQQRIIELAGQEELEMQLLSGMDLGRRIAEEAMCNKMKKEELGEILDWLFDYIPFSKNDKLKSRFDIFLAEITLAMADVNLKDVDLIP